jgi:endonuclease G
MKRYIILVFFIIVPFISIAQIKDKSSTCYFLKDTLNENNIKPVAIRNLEFPFAADTYDIISHTGYSFQFSDKNKQSIWIAYHLTSKETEKIFEREDRFLPDKKVKNGTANDSDYKGSGYDRGHLAPAADMSWSEITMKESFFYSNMSPQKPSFNRGIWKKLEELVRSWAIQNEELYIVTGGVLNDSLPYIGNKVSIPKYYYKVILDYKEPSVKGIGFIMPNEASKDSLHSFAVTIDSVERFTGINFFHKLPDNQESVIEQTISIKSWIWKNN